MGTGFSSSNKYIDTLAMYIIRFILNHFCSTIYSHTGLYFVGFVYLSISIYCKYVWTCKHVCVSFEGQRTTCGRQFSSSTVCVPALKLRSSDLTTSSFPAESPCQPSVALINFSLCCLHCILHKCIKPNQFQVASHCSTTSWT